MPLRPVAMYFGYSWEILYEVNESGQEINSLRIIKEKGKQNTGCSIILENRAVYELSDKGQAGAASSKRHRLVTQIPER